MKGFRQNLRQFWYKETLWTFFLFFFFCLINWNSFSAFITTLRMYQMMHWIIKHALQNLGCKSKTKYIDYLPRTKAYLFSKKIKEIWDQRLFVCRENDRKKVRKKIKPKILDYWHVQPMVVVKQQDHERPKCRSSLHSISLS